MLDLLLIAFFTAFFLAVLDSALEFAAVMVGTIFVNTVTSLLLSCLGAYLIGLDFNKKITVIIVAGAFLGKSLLKITERMIAYRPVMVNSTRQ